MSDMKYIVPSRDEVLVLGMVSGVFAFLFSMMFLRFDSGSTLFDVFFSFFLFLFIFYFSRLIVMKLVGLKNAFEINLDFNYFDKFGFRKFDKLSYYKKKVEKVAVKSSLAVAHSAGTLKEVEYHKSDFMNKGIPVLFLSVFGYILTLGFFVSPGVFKYKIKKIPHLFLGTQQYHENDVLFYYNMEISDYRISKALFFGFLYYFIFGIFLKLFFEGSSYYYWFMFILFWVGIVSLVPVPSTEGFALFRTNNFAWIMAITILILSCAGLLIFNSIQYMIIIFIFSFLGLFFVFLWRQVMGGGH